MYYAEISAETPAGNLAMDEALLQSSEDGAGHEVLRFWESSLPFIVLGYGCRAATEADLALAEFRGVPVLRRITGGGTVMQGPGCLNYALVLSAAKEETATIGRANAFIMNVMRKALQPLSGQQIRIEGFTDLTISSRKFSGNSQRRLKKFLLFHGTVLYQFDIGLVDELLPPPLRQPAYRADRAHSSFLVNFSADREAIIGALRGAWKAEDTMVDVPVTLTQELCLRRYSSPDWNFKF